MKVCHILLIILLMSSGMGPCYAGLTDTAYAKAESAPVRKIDSSALKKTVSAPMARTDTAIVRSYNGIPVFYHCKPLHKYTRLGYMTRSTLVSYLTKAFEKYTNAARKHAKGHLGILIDDTNFGTDSFDVVRFSPADGNADTALFTTPIFVSARPTRPYKVIRVLNDRFGSGSLNANLQCYMQDAQDLHRHYDGIIIRDVNYEFGKNAIFVFRWKKKSEIIATPPAPPSQSAAIKP